MLSENFVETLKNATFIANLGCHVQDHSKQHPLLDFSKKNHANGIYSILLEPFTKSLFGSN